jgi:hypothetical protein
MPERVFTKLDMYIAAYLLKARTVEPEKQSLLANGSKTAIVSRERLGKYVSMATDKHVATEVVLETVFSNRSVQKGYKEDNWSNRVSIPYGGGSSRRRRKGTQCLGV